MGPCFKTNFQKLLNHFCKEELLENTRVIFMGVLQFWPLEWVQGVGNDTHSTTPPSAKLDFSRYLGDYPTIWLDQEVQYFNYQ